MIAMEGAYDATLRAAAKIEDAKPYESMLKRMAKKYGLEITIESKRTFPEEIRVRVAGGHKKLDSKPAELPKVKYETFEGDLYETLKNQIEPHLENPQSELIVQRAIREDKAHRKPASA